MKIAIVGSSGYIAGFLIERWKRNKEIEHILRLDQSDEAEAYINLQRADEFNYSVLEQIDFVIFTAAISGPDQCASDFDFCWKINVTGTSYFIRRERVVRLHDRKACGLFGIEHDAEFAAVCGRAYGL